MRELLDITSCFRILTLILITLKLAKIGDVSDLSWFVVLLPAVLPGLCEAFYNFILVIIQMFRN